MDPALASRIVCPICGGDLAPHTFASGDGATGEGVLLCARCRAWYPVSGSIPVLLDFRTPLHDAFAAAHADRLGAHDGYRPPPRSRARPGEESVQETFGEEWRALGESSLSFLYSHEDLVELNRQVWLRWLDRPEHRGRVGSVLDVGCGLGAEALALKELLPDAEVVAVDLNLALAGSPHARSHASGVRFAVASLFALPFRPRSFDLVYAQGVLHHSYSTWTALERVAAHVADEGYLFVWLYGREDHLGLSGRRAIATRAALALERVLRPALAASPPRARGAFFAAATRAVHPLLKPRMRHKGRWERENTDHHLRDWLSPRYAHRHGWNEVLTWLEELGFDVVDVQSPTAYRRLYGDRLWGVGLTGRRRLGD